MCLKKEATHRLKLSNKLDDKIQTSDRNRRSLNIMLKFSHKVTKALIKDPTKSQNHQMGFSLLLFHATQVQRGKNPQSSIV